jgi:UDP-glucose:(heptosyl)LPS alpha-1,3-glucosyltransferase
MNIAFCYESVLPARGGCEMYITDLARRLLAERHEVHLYACRWDEQWMPAGIHYHPLSVVRGPRFLRPWRFAAACENALKQDRHDVSLGFNKTWGQDILYPQGGLHVASYHHNLRKFDSGGRRALARLCRLVDPAHRSFLRLERKQYLREPRPLIVVNSLMVRRHFQQFYGIPGDRIFVVRSAVDPTRFDEKDRPRRRQECRQQWGLDSAHTVGLFAAMNYRLKGLDPLLYAVRSLIRDPEFRDSAGTFRLLVVGSPDVRAYEKLARRLGIARHVIFAGHCGDMRNAYFASDFLVHPTFYDPCSLVVLEALACALPVITTRANGASELLHPLQEGFVIDDPHDHTHLAWCMGQLLCPDRRRRYSVAARRTAASWTFDHHYQALLSVFRQAAAAKHAA